MFDISLKNQAHRAFHGEDFAFEKSSEATQAAFEYWAAAVRSLNPEKVVRLYAKDATFLGTLAPHLSQDLTSIKSYFDFFLDKDRVEIHDVTGTVQVMSETLTMYSGIYHFRLTTKSEVEDIPARFTFVFRKFTTAAGHEAFEILHHHSSRIPS